MDENSRTIRWIDGHLKFPCGVKVELTEKKLKWVLTTFKLTNELEELLSDGKMTISRSTTFQLRSYLI